MNALFSSRHLHFREWVEEDASFFYQLNRDPEVMRYTGDTSWASEEEARAFVRGYDHFRKHGMGRWLISLKDSGESIGWCGLKMVKDGSGPKELNAGYVDLGYRLSREYWGKGLATEAAFAAAAYGFDQLHLQEIIGRAVPENIASIRVLENIGMQAFWQGECDLHFATYHRLTKEEFNASRKALEPRYSAQFE